MKIYFISIIFIISLAAGFINSQLLVMKSLVKCRSEIFSKICLIDTSIYKLEKLQLELSISGTSPDRVLAIRDEKNREYDFQANIRLELLDQLDRYRKTESYYLLPMDLRYKMNVYKQDDFLDDHIFNSIYDPFFKSSRAIERMNKS